VRVWIISSRTDLPQSISSIHSLSSNIVIHAASSVNNLCPLSTIIYVLVLNPLLISFAETLWGLKITPKSWKVSVFAYVDDVTIILSSPTRVEAVRKSLNFYQRAAVAFLKLTKSKTLPMGVLNTEIDPMGITYVKKNRKVWICYSIRRSRWKPDSHGLPLLHATDIHCAQLCDVTWTFCSASVT